MESKFKKEISIVVPTYNEAGNVEELIAKINSALLSAGFDYEIIFVDDHSTDSTRNKILAASSIYPVKVLLKKGKKGKAYSLQEGFAETKFRNIAMIDADLQYPPAAIVQMAYKLAKADIVVADRKSYKDSFARKILSRTFRNLFGKGLFGIESDIQSGLKVFKRSVVEIIRFRPSSQWTFDLEFLHRSRQAGYIIENYDITFQKRKKGSSSIGMLKTTFEIGSNALDLKLSTLEPKSILPEEKNSMQGAGLRHNTKKFITHTTLHHTKSAIKTFSGLQKFVIALILELTVLGMILNPIFTLQTLIAVLSFIYFTDTIFNFFIVYKSLHRDQEIIVDDMVLNNVNEKELPIYSILCPLYKEAHVIPQFVDAISKLSWPKEKLDVILLLEEDDLESIKKASAMKLPKHIRIVVVPNSQPKTKPKACNYGLAFAKGEYLVIYDAEDLPEVDQLKKAYFAFQKVPKNVICLQAKLNYYNPNQNLLTRFFTAEYSLWFDVTLTGYQSINTSIPLGGTSNHFRTKDLMSLEGWDPFNVTEDADLGVRLFKAGYRTAIIDSTTYEEANSKWGNWVRQRSRWIKGYMQTYLVHTRNPLDFIKSSKEHSFLFNLIFGGKISFILINPFLWLATISYFCLYSIVGPTIERLYPGLVFYMAAFSLVFGNFLSLYYYMVGAMKRKQYGLIKYTFLIPFYWLMISIAGFLALYQLFFKPFYWEKTVHGLHLKKAKVSKREFNIPKIILIPVRYGMSLFV